MKIGVNGCFDVLTVGHFNLLMFARGLADKDGIGKVIVFLDEDDKIRADKGLDRPVFDVHERAKAILDIKLPDGRKAVDAIEFFSTNLHLEMMLKRIRPDLIIKGDDWKGKKVVGDDIAKVIFFERQPYSTTDIILRCQSKIIVK